MTSNIKIWCIWTNKRWKNRRFGPRKASELGRLFIYNLTKLTNKKQIWFHPNIQTTKKVAKPFGKMNVFVGKNFGLLCCFGLLGCFCQQKNRHPPRPVHPVTPDCKSSNGSCQWHIHFRLGRSAQRFDGGIFGGECLHLSLLRESLWGNLVAQLQMIICK